MKTFKYLSVVLMVFCLVSCAGKKKSGNPNSVTGNPNSVTLKVESDLGSLSSYVSVSESEITLKLIEDKIKGSVGFYVKKAYKGKYSWDLCFEVEVLDESHICIAELGDTEFDHPIGKYIVNAGNKRTNINKTGDLWEKIKDEGKYLSIKFDRSDEEITPYSESASDKDKATETSGNTSSF